MHCSHAESRLNVSSSYFSLTDRAVRVQLEDFAAEGIIPGSGWVLICCYSFVLIADIDIHGILMPACAGDVVYGFNFWLRLNPLACYFQDPVERGLVFLEEWHSVVPTVAFGLITQVFLLGVGQLITAAKVDWVCWALWKQTGSTLYLHLILLYCCGWKGCFGFECYNRCCSEWIYYFTYCLIWVHWMMLLSPICPSHLSSSLMLLMVGT